MPSFYQHSLSDHYLNSCCAIQLKYDILMRHRNIQVEFEFGSAPKIFFFFTEKCLHLELRKKNMRNSLFSRQLKFDIGVCHINIQTEFEFGSSLMIFDRVMPLELKLLKFWPPAGALLALRHI